MVGKNQMAPVGDEEASFERDAGFLQGIAFSEKGFRIEDDTATDDTNRTLMEDPGRHHVKDETTPVEGDRMSCVVSTLITRDTIKPIGEDIDDLSFSFVAPLKTDDRNIFLHEGLLGFTKV